MNRKTYILNGKEVDEYGNVVKTTKSESILKSKETAKTSAKICNRIIAIALIATGIITYTIVSKAEDYSVKLEETQSMYETIQEDVQVIPSTYKFLYTDTGEKYVINDLTIAENLAGCNACKVDGVYYSRDAEEIVVLKITQKYQTVSSAVVSIRYCAPEGYVLVGNKCYKEEVVTNAIARENQDGTITYFAPEGYILYGTKAVKAEAFDDAIRAEEEIYYTAPTGYVLQGTKAVKTTQYTTEYLLTQEQYENGEFDHLTKKIGEYVSHSVEIVKAEPMSDLYQQLGIEYEMPEKLTK